MTRKERKLLGQIVGIIEYPSVQRSEFTEAGEFKQVNTHEETNRRLSSADYKLGWEACRDRVKEYLKELLK